MTETARVTHATKSNETTMAFVAYLLTWITGLIVLLTSEKNLKFQRWHAIQAIGLGIAFTAVYVVLSIILVPLLFSGAAMVASLLTTAVWVGFLILWILLMVNAYQGKKLRLPIISGFADKNA